MLEKLLSLCADSEFASELYQAVEKLEERKGANKDTKELKSITLNIQKLCQEIH